jgi:hypothetical protein
MGSGSDKAAREANRMEKERQAEIQRGTKRVNSIFDAPERAAQRGDFLSALREHYRTQLDRSKGTADRRLRFAMARSGLTGGSAAADAGRTMGEEYTRGLLDVDTRAQGALADLEGQDEQSRLQLLSAIQSGLDATTAANRASSALRVNVGNAQANAFADQLGDVFGDTAQIYKRQEENAERRRGERAAYDALYGRRMY